MISLSALNPTALFRLTGPSQGLMKTLLDTIKDNYKICDILKMLLV